MIFASNPISAAAQPLFKVFAIVLAFFYRLVPNYAAAIALLTVAVMVVVFPITRRGTRSMMRMQIYAPELKKLQQRYKAPPGATAAEKTELRQRQQEEMMAFYRENNISPTGGCLPMFLQLPIFWILYGTIRGLVHTTTEKVHIAGKLVTQYVADPLYISHTSRLYQSIKAANPRAVLNSANIKLDALGINLADSVRSPGSIVHKLPYIALILGAVVLQYVQMKQLSGRNPAAQQANPQMAQMQKFFPIIFAVIYIAIPSGVNIYFIVSSLFRISQQEFMYRRDPQLQESLRQLRERHAKAAAGKPAGGQKAIAAGKGARAAGNAAEGAAAQRPRGLLGGLRLGVANALAGGESGPAGAPARSSPSSGSSRNDGAAEKGKGPARAGSAAAAGGDKVPAASNGRPAKASSGGGGQQARNGSPAASSSARPTERPPIPGGGSQLKPRNHPRSQGKRARRPR